jgi:MOSC domain-containing protein YiiM
MIEVAALHRSPVHGFSKLAEEALTFIAGVGIEGDAHAGATVKHRSRVAADPMQPNFRQVHLIHAEMIDEVNAQGFSIRPGDVGENITTRGLDLLSLPRYARLHIGAVILSVTGLRNPCAQLDNFAPGLTQAFLGRTPDGGLIRKAGIMAIVLEGGVARRGDRIGIELPRHPHLPLDRV